MSTDPREYQIPVIIDVTAWSYDEAAETAVQALAQGRIPGRTHRPEGMENSRPCQVESWWTVERASKEADGNDNEHGVVVFEHDLDYLHQLLVRHAPVQGYPTVNGNNNVERHMRLLDYFDRDTGRIGTDYDTPEA